MKFTACTVLAVLAGAILGGGSEYLHNRTYAQKYAAVVRAVSASSQHAIHPAADYVMVGDSLTAFGPWQELFSGASFANRGILGDTSDLILARIPDIGLVHAKTAFVMAGINDILRGGHLQDITGRYQQLVLQLRNDGMRVVVQGTLPVASWRNGSARINADVLALNSAMSAFCEREHIEHISIIVGDERAFYIFDGLHITGAAYLSWRDQISRFVS